MSDNKDISKEIVLEDVIVASIKIPGVKVNRNKFLAEQFANSGKNIQDIIELGPIEAGFTREEIAYISKKLIMKRTSQSSLASFAAGIPGGLAMAATIPADVMQFFGMALRLAQELSYIYGSQDLWQNGQVDDDRVKSQLILYCGVMFGVSGAVSGVRVLSTQIAKTTLKKLPQKALTKTFWYPILKNIGKSIGIKITKTTVANGVSKAIPVIGGVISGTLNFASMMPMANRLQKTFDKVMFDYSDDDFTKDMEEIEKFSDSSFDIEDSNIKNRISNGAKSVGFHISNLVENISKKDKKISENEKNYSFEAIKKYKELFDMGIITEEEFNQKKHELLNL